MCSAFLMRHFTDMYSDALKSLGCTLVISPVTWLGSKKRADSLQHKYLRRLLRLHGPVPRCILLSEHDIGRRLSVDLDAIMLWNRIMTYPKYNRVLQACELAAKHKGTWTAHVVKMMKNCGVITVSLKFRGVGNKPHKGQKHTLQRYRKEHVLPALTAWDKNTWWGAQAQREHMSKLPLEGFSVIAASNTGASIAAVRHWAQLKLQGYFSRPGVVEPRHDDPRRCQLCLGSVQESAKHLLVDCPGTDSIEREALLMLPPSAQADVGRRIGATWAQYVLGQCGEGELPVMIEYVHQVAQEARRVEFQRSAVEETSGSSSHSESSESESNLSGSDPEPGDSDPDKSEWQQL